MRKLIWIPLLSLLTIFIPGCDESTKIKTVGYLQITQDPVLDVAKRGVFSALGDSGYIDGKNFRLIEENAQGDLSLIPMILQGFISQGVDIIITNSTPCMIAAAQLVKDIPVVFTVSFDPKEMGLKTIPDNLYGVYGPTNEVLFIDMLMEAVPYMKRVGIPYNNAERNAEFSTGKYCAEFARRGIEVVKTSVVSSNDILMAGEYLAGKKVDVLLVCADNTLHLGLNTLARVASEAKIPLFVTDPLHVDKGAAVGYGTNFQQWGYMAGLKAIRLLKGEALKPDKKIEPIQKLDLIINKKASAQQGLFLSASFLSKATKVI